MLQCYSSRWVTTYMSDNYKKKTYMSDLRLSCFFGRMICTECESLVSGIGCFMMHIARATLPTFFTCSFFKKHFRNRKHVQHMSFCSHKKTMSTFSGKYEGSQTTFLHFAVSPSEVTPYALPLSSNSTCKPLASLAKSSEN